MYAHVGLATPHMYIDQEFPSPTCLVIIPRREHACMHHMEMEMEMEEEYGGETTQKRPVEHTRLIRHDKHNIKK